MWRWARRIGSLVAAGALVGFVGTANAAIPTVYVGYNSSNCTFTVTNDAGATVTTLAPGGYQVVITTSEPYALVGMGSPSSLANCGGYVQFSLTGPGVNLATTLGEGDATFELDSVTLQAGGVYTMEDASNVAGSKTGFAVATTGAAGSVSAPSSTSSSSSKAGAGSTTSPSTSSAAGHSTGGGVSAIGTSIALRGTLVGTVAAGNKLTLTSKGKPVENLTAGRYVFSIVDRSRSSGFTLQVIRGNPIIVTGGGFVGRHTTSVILNRGQWVYYGARAGKRTYFIVTG